MELYASGQVLREYLVAATRPVIKKGLGLSNGDALDNLRQFRRTLSVCPENLECNTKLLEWAERCKALGRNFDDLNILATLWASGLEVLLTQNGKDFPQDTGIEILGLELF